MWVCQRSMSIPSERLKECLIRLPEALRGIFKDWASFDEDLQEHYTSDVEWLISSAQYHIEEGSIAGVEVDQAISKLLSLREDLESKMGIVLADLLSLPLITPAL